MSNPKTYAEWMVCFNQFKEGAKDEETIQSMESGVINWSKGVAERLTQRLYEAIDYRLRLSANQLQKDLDYSRDIETEVVKALLSARKRLAVIHRAATIRSFPEEVRDTMENLLIDYAKNTQQSLEDSAKSDRTGRLRMMIGNNPITTFDKVENLFGAVKTSVEDNQIKDSSNQMNGKMNRRRVILS
ncbi:hypothetical protein [Oceanobacillus manasiensis]|uniref:hypothetical protein n=1 Tax=Oceanobacillus manasiensis TaxID=586413 RepID=UPI0005A6EB90|nr:hypothetical protein [Oceanobacillus manasiensis]